MWIWDLWVEGVWVCGLEGCGWGVGGVWVGIWDIWGEGGFAPLPHPHLILRGSYSSIVMDVEFAVYLDNEKTEGYERTRHQEQRGP